jgi:MFS family permease
MAEEAVPPPSLLASLKSRLHYGWVIFGLTFSNLTIEGGAKNSQPVFLVALHQSFGSSVTLTSAIFSISGLVGAFSSPVLGRLLDRFGPRVMFPLAGAFILMGWVASSFAGSIWHLFIFYGIFATLGQTMVSSFSATATLAPWFPRSKGVVLGVADSGNPAGQALVIPLAQVIASTLGWRAAYQIFGVAFFLVAAPLNLFFQRRPPVDLEPLPDLAPPGPEALVVPRFPEIQSPEIQSPEIQSRDIIAGEAEPPAAREPLSREPLSVKVMLRQPAVWLLLSTRALASTANQMTQVHLIAFFMLAGYGELQAAVAIGVGGLLGIGGRPGFGLMSDVMGRESVFTVGMIMSLGSIVVVLFFGGSGSMLVLVVFVALAGLSDGLSGLLVGAKAADLYPPRALGTVMGVVEVGRGIGIALGPVLAGFLFDLQGDYVVAFSLAAGLTFASICTMWGVRLTQGEARY